MFLFNFLLAIMPLPNLFFSSKSNNLHYTPFQLSILQKLVNSTMKTVDVHPDSLPFAFTIPKLSHFLSQPNTN